MVKIMTDQTQHPEPSDLRQRALALYTPPFRYQHGFIFDSAHQVAADDPAERGAAGRVRGWGRIQQMPDGAKLQDEFGKVLVDALDMYYASKVPKPDEHEALTFHELPEQQPKQPKPLRVVIKSYPESNGKRNWTALFMREERFAGLVGNGGGVTIDRGEYWNRVAYFSERARVLLGLRESEPDLIEYGEDVLTPEEWEGKDPEAGHGY